VEEGETLSSSSSSSSVANARSRVGGGPPGDAREPHLVHRHRALAEEARPVRRVRSARRVNPRASPRTPPPRRRRPRGAPRRRLLERLLERVARAPRASTGSPASGASAASERVAAPFVVGTTADGLHRATTYPAGSSALSSTSTRRTARHRTSTRPSIISWCATTTHSTP
jgi:hypothetical protein